MSRICRLDIHALSLGQPLLEGREVDLQVAALGRLFRAAAIIHPLSSKLSGPLLVDNLGNDRVVETTVVAAMPAMQSSIPDFAPYPNVPPEFGETAKFNIIIRQTAGRDLILAFEPQRQAGAPFGVCRARMKRRTKQPSSVERREGEILQVYIRRNWRIGPVIHRPPHSRSLAAVPQPWYRWPQRDRHQPPAAAR